MTLSRTLLVGALSILLTTTSALAQLSTAQLSGRVTDESGAVLPGVTVTATQTDTVSSRLPIPSTTLMAGVAATCRTIPVCEYVRNPWSIASSR